MDNGEIDLWSTHTPVLAACAIHTTGPILELGCGHYSTRLLHALCPNRKLITVDINKKYIDMLSYLKSDNHEIFLVDDILEWLQRQQASNVLPHDFGFIFEDSGRAQKRFDHIKFLRHRTDLFVLNNTEHVDGGTPYRKAYAGYERIIPTYEFKHDYKAYPVWTSILSDKPLPTWVKEIV